MSGRDVYGGVAPPSSSSWAVDARARPLSQRKGLTNDAGENNCFLNVIIQSLWHVRSCRVLISMGDHAVHHRCAGEPTNAGRAAAASASSTSGQETGTAACLLCELEQIFILYQFSEQPVLEVDRVRRALGDVFALGAMNDATETLEAILDALHFDTFNRMLLLKRGVTLDHHVGAGVRDTDLTQSVRADAAAIVCEPQCVAHLLFQMNLMELRTCAACGETAEPLMNTDFLYRVYAQELLQQVKDATAKTNKAPTLEEVLCREAQGVDGGGTGGSCDACKRGGTMRTSRWMLTLPMVFAISIIWSSDMVNKAEVKSWMDLLSTQHKGGDDHQTQKLDLSRIFRLDKSTGVSAEYSFRGMVCYYGRHYVGFFASRSLEDGKAQERWFLFDDTRVKRVGTWADVRLRIERGGYQPTLLFYERTGIQLDKLEKTASEIHKWWEETAEEKAAKAAEEDAAAVGGDAVLVTADDHAVSDSFPSAAAAPPSVDSLAASLRRSVRLTPTVVLPTSPIRVPKGPPMSVPAAEVPLWHDENIHLTTLSAQDTISKLNNILNKDRAPATVQPDGRDMLRMAMSMSMRQSVRRRDYSVHKLTDQQLNVNRDAIFMDLNEETVPVAEKKATAVSTKASTNGGIAPIDVKRSSPTKPPRPTASNSSTPQRSIGPREFHVELRATDGGIGLILDESEQESIPSSSSVRDSAKKKRVFTVAGFEVNGAGAKLPAEASGAIEKGDALVGINGRAVEADALYDVLEQLLTATSPVRLTFHRHEPWACPRCTLLNDVKEAQCGACGHSV